MSDIPVTDNKNYDVESLWVSWFLTPDRMEIKYEDSNSASWIVNSIWDNDSMISGHQNLTMYLRVKDEKIEKLQSQLNEAEKVIELGDYWNELNVNDYLVTRSKYLTKYKTNK